MIPVYVCEDNPVQLEMIREIIEKLIFIEDYHMEIQCAAIHPEQLLNHLTPGIPTGIYFLDIDLNGKMNGLQLAEKIRQYDPYGFLIFITAYYELWKLTFEYKVSAFDFINKNQRETLGMNIASSLHAAWQQYSRLHASAKKTVPLRVNGKILYQDIQELLYMESASSHRIILHGMKQMIHTSGDLNAFEKILPEYFFRCHRSCIINLKQVSVFDEQNNSVSFPDQTQCPVAFRKRRLLKESLASLR